MLKEITSGIIWIRIRGDTFIFEFFIVSVYNFKMKRKKMKVGAGFRVIQVCR